jgi:hypothetical protein
MREIGAFFKKSGKVIIPLTVREILVGACCQVRQSQSANTHRSGRIKKSMLTDEPLVFLGRRLVVLTTAVATLLFASCSRGEVAGTLRDLQEVQRQVSMLVGTNATAVSVNLNNSRLLNIGVINSSWNDKPVSDRQQEGRRIAQVAFKSFPSRSDLQTVSVTFVIQRTYFLFLHYTYTRDSFVFEAVDLDTPNPPPAPKDSNVR